MSIRKNIPAVALLVATTFFGASCAFADGPGPAGTALQNAFGAPIDTVPLVDTYVLTYDAATGSVKFMANAPAPGAYVAPSRTISTTSPLTGGGDLSANRTFALTTVPVNLGGTNITSYAVGDIVYASGAGTLAKLADVATGQYLKSGGVGVAPLYGTLALADFPTINVATGGTNITSYTAGDILVATGSTTLTKLAKGADNTVLTVTAGSVGWAAPSSTATGWSYSSPSVTLTTMTDRIAIGTNPQAGYKLYVAGDSGGKNIALAPGGGGGFVTLAAQNGNTLTLSDSTFTLSMGSGNMDTRGAAQQGRSLSLCGSSGGAAAPDNMLRFYGTTSGSCTIAAPAIAGTTSVTLPSASGVVALLDGAQTFTSATWNGTAIGAAYLTTMVGDSGSGGVKGAVPAPATGDATKFLRGDATWVTVSSGSTYAIAPSGGTATANGANSFTAGTSATCDGANSASFGEGATCAGASSLSAGYGSRCDAPNSVAIGRGATIVTTFGGNFATAVGYGASCGSSYCTSIGYNAAGSRYGSTSIGGISNTGIGQLTTCVGFDSGAYVTYASAFGASTRCNYVSSVMGYGSTATADGQFVCGSATAPVTDVYFGQGVGSPAFTLHGPVSLTGALVFNGSTSGTCSLQVPAVAGTTSFRLPPNNGTSGYLLRTDGAGVCTWVAPSGAASSLAATLAVGFVSGGSDISLTGGGKLTTASGMGETLYLDGGDEVQVRSGRDGSDAAVRIISASSSAQNSNFNVATQVILTANYGRAYLDGNGSFVISPSTQPTQSSSTGFLYVPQVATGAPTGTPKTVTACVPIAAGTDNHLYAYMNGAWRQLDN